jgi:hypothetical protein
VTHQTDFQKPSMAEIHLMEISATAEIKIKLPRKIIIHPTRISSSTAGGSERELQSAC